MIAKITEIYEQIYTFEYGYLDKSNIKHKITTWDANMWRDFVQKYRYLSPSLIQKHKIGICLDINNYLYHKIKAKIKGTYRMMYICLTELEPNVLKNARNEHCFLLLEKDSRFFLIYSAHSRKILTFESIQKALTYEIQGFLRGTDKNYVAVVKYKDTHYNESYNDFVKARINDIKSKNIKHHLNDFDVDRDSFVLKLD